MVVLIVEDNWLIASGLREAVASISGVSVELAATVPRAEAVLAVCTVDFALLDVNLRAGTTYGFARKLRDGGIPFAFTTGSDRSDVPDDLRDAPFLSKPCRFEAVLNIVRKSLDGGALKPSQA